MVHLGHRSIQMTFGRYGHLMPGDGTDAVDLLDAWPARASDPEIGGEA